MIINEFIDKDLGHVSYIFEDDEIKEIVIVDSRRDIDVYRDSIKNNGYHNVCI